MGCCQDDENTPTPKDFVAVIGIIILMALGIWKALELVW